MRVGQEILGVHGDVERFRRVVFVPLQELRTFVPERAGDDVIHPIVIDVAEVGALAEELLRKLFLLEGMLHELVVIVPLMGHGERGGDGD
jgi:hypothetical protein